MLRSPSLRRSHSLGVQRKLRTIEKCQFAVLPQFRDANNNKFNLGTAGPALDAQAGSTATADTNDPTYYEAGDTYDDKDLIERTCDGPTDELQTDDYFEVANETKWTNLITNPEFGTNTTGWAAVGTNTIERVSLADEGLSTAGLPPGVTHALKCTYGNAATMAQFALTVADLTQHKGLGYVLVPAAYDGTDLELQFANYVGSGPTAASVDMTKTDAWQLASGLDMTTAGDVAGEIRLRDEGTAPTVGSVVYLTAVQAEVGATANPYRSGSHPLGRWTGTAHASTSESRSNLDLLIDSSAMGLIAKRTYDNTPASNEALFNKKADMTGTAAGWTIYEGTGANSNHRISDGSVSTLDQISSATNGAVAVQAFVRDVGADDLEGFMDGVGSGSPTTDATTTSLVNDRPMRVGATAAATPGGYAAIEHFGSAFWNTHDNPAPTDKEVEMASRQLAAATGRSI